MPLNTSDIVGLDFHLGGLPFTMMGTVDTNTLDYALGGVPFYAAGFTEPDPGALGVEFFVNVDFTPSLTTAIPLIGAFDIDVNFTGGINLGNPAKMFQIF